MHLTETVTIINNSGKIISTGKHLVNIFKDAKAAYQERKAALKAERSFVDPPPFGGIQRSQTFDVPPRRPSHQHNYPDGPYYEYDEYDNGEYDYDDDGRYYDRPYYIAEGGRRHSHDAALVDDRRSEASSRRSQGSHGPRRSNRSEYSGGRKKPQPLLTASNLRTLSEVSSTSPSAAPRNYRSPYAETAPRDMALSRPTLNHAATMTIPPTPTSLLPPDPGTYMYDESPVPTPRQSMLVHRPHSNPSLRQSEKEIDLNLAYGNVPPDLESRVDLDPAYEASPEFQERQARTLMQKIESVLLEAQCIHNSATAIISHLQANPEAAAAVALTLAELSALLGKMSPAFLGVVKGGFPAIFALLASPQFLIAAGVTVGVTVVMFGGWKIVKRIRTAQALKAADANAAQNAAQAFEMQERIAHEQAAAQEEAFRAGIAFARGVAADAGGGVAGSGFDEALVLEEELSTIETWRRGIVPFGEDERADMELISPEAERAMRAEQRRRGGYDDDAMSRQTGRTTRTHRSHKSHKSGKTSKSTRRDHSDGEEEDGPREIPDRKSSRGFSSSRDDKEARSEAGSTQSRRSSRSKRSEKVLLKAIEETPRDDTNTLNMVLRPKDKKSNNNNMLRSIFKKKKDREERESRVGVSVMV